MNVSNWIETKDYLYRELENSIEVKFTGVNTLMGRIYPNQEKILVIKCGEVWSIKDVQKD